MSASLKDLLLNSPSKHIPTTKCRDLSVPLDNHYLIIFQESQAKWAFRVAVFWISWSCSEIPIAKIPQFPRPALHTVSSWAGKKRQSLEDAHASFLCFVGYSDDTPYVCTTGPNSTGHSWQLHWVAQTRRPFLHCNCGSFLRLSMISSELPMDGWCIWPLESCHLFDQSLLGKEQQDNTEKLQKIGEIFAMEINILPPTHHQLRSKHLCDISQPQTSDWEWMMVRWRWLLDGYYTWWLSDQWPIRYLYIYHIISYIYIHKIIYIIIYAC
jgi:hypothetical protein